MLETPLFSRVLPSFSRSPSSHFFFSFFFLTSPSEHVGRVLVVPRPADLGPPLFSRGDQFSSFCCLFREMGRSERRIGPQRSGFCLFQDLLLARSPRFVPLLSLLPSSCNDHTGQLRLVFVFVVSFCAQQASRMRSLDLGSPLERRQCL